MGTNGFNIYSFFTRFTKGKEDLLRDFASGEYRRDLLLAALIGVIGGYGAVGFRYAIEGAQFLFYRQPGTTVDFLLSIPWYWRLSIPILGALIVGQITTRWATEARGYGVTEVIASVATRGGIIRPRVAFAKVLASAVCIGSGGSAGREGPIVQIGSSIASVLGQWLRLSPRRLKTFVGCGAAAGIAATFNAPIAGMLFSLEIIIGNFAMAQLSPMIVASVTATAISRWHLGNNPAFSVPHYGLQSPLELVHYAVLGLAAGVVAVIFIRVLNTTENFFNNLKFPDSLKPAIGGLIIGIIGAMGLPHVYGVGYDVIETSLSGYLPLGMMALLILMKIFATSATLGTGGSGGIFAPSLFLGAMLGGIIWYAARIISPDLVTVHHGAYSLVGMAAFVAASTHAPLQAILILLELTNGYVIILPLMLSSILAVAVSSKLLSDNIYTIRLRSRGILLGRGAEVNVFRGINVKDVMRSEVSTVPFNMRLKPLLDTVSDSNLHTTLFVLDSEDRLKGYISFNEIRSVLFDIEVLEPILVADDITNYEMPVVTPGDNLDIVMRLFARKNLDELPVVDENDHQKLIGTVQRSDVVEAYNAEIMKRDLLGSMKTSFEAATRMTSDSIIPGYSMAEVEVPFEFVNKDLKTIDLRRVHGIEVIFVRRHTRGKSGEKEKIIPTPDLVLKPGDILLVTGPQDVVEKISKA